MQNKTLYYRVYAKIFIKRPFIQGSLTYWH